MIHTLLHHPHLQHYWADTTGLTQVFGGKLNYLQDNPPYTTAGAPDLLICEKQSPVQYDTWPTGQYCDQLEEPLPDLDFYLEAQALTFHPSVSTLLLSIVSLQRQSDPKIMSSLSQPISATLRRDLLQFKCFSGWLTQYHSDLLAHAPQDCVWLEFMVRHGKCATHRNILIWVSCATP